MRATRPDVAVVDNRLLDGRGVDLCEVLRREVPEIALVIHSAAITAAETDRALALGVRAVVRKTIRASGLLDAIASAANRRAAR